MPQGPEDGNKDKISEISESKYEDQITTSPVVTCAQNVLSQTTTPPPAKRLRTSSPSGITTAGTAQGATSPRASVKNHASPPQFRNIAISKAVGGALQSLQSSAIIGQPGSSTTVHNISSASLQNLAAALGIPGIQRSGSASEMLSLGINVTGDLTQLLLTETSVSAPSPVAVTCSMQTIPTVTAALPQRVVVSSDAPLAVLGPETVNALKQQQAPVSIAGPVPCDNITSVHSYSLASVITCSSAPSSSPQKSEPKRTITTSMHPSPASPRTLTKRPRATPQSPSDNCPINSTIVSELIVCFRKANKVLYRVPDDVAGCDPKVKTTPPVSRPKKIKMEKIPVSEEILQKRQKILQALTVKNDLLRRCYYNRHTEMWCLKNKCYLDYFEVMKNPPPALEEHLKSNLYTGDSEQELKKLQEILATPGGLLPPVPPFLRRQKNVPAKSQVSPGKSNQNVTASSHSRSSPSRSPTSQGIVGTKVISSSTPIASTTVTRAIKQPLVTPRFAVKHNSLSAVYDSSIGSQEEIVERAKQEAYVMQRIGELRKEGLWSLKRLPKVQETPRSKAHWDYLLEEMVWLATDFAQERKWKKAAAKKCSRMIVKHFQEKEMRVEKAEKEVHMRVRRIASAMAKEIRNFWTNIEKLVEYKQQTWLDAKKKKVLDSHLNFIVDQTEKYSSWLTQGLNRTIMESNGTSRASSPSTETKISGRKRSYEDDEFQPEDSDEDNEESIDKEGFVGDEEEEIKLLQQESLLPLEDLLETLPKEILEKPAPLLDSCSNDSESDLSSSEEMEEKDGELKKEDDDDEEFKVPSSEADEPDDEETLLEQEEKEKDIDYSSEIKKLQEESEVPIEELFKKYEDAFGSECELSELEDLSDDDEDGLKSLEEMVMDDEKAETSVEPSEGKPNRFESSDKSPSKEITDIAATAESFQPKGNTLSTTKVCTKVPFLLKHQLREYQHIGLDWLNAMFEKKLNGILADEMGLGKTIQTIALLANLACEKGNWGPHLIVVPTSVMLNWEMEFKKWCPGFKILTYYGSPKERKQKRMGWTKPNAFHVCITSYKLVVQDHQSFRRKKWVYLILDEAQHIKNFKSQRWQMLLNFQSTHRLLLTGTPLQNNLMELWSLMHFLMPNVFQSHKDFREWFVNPVTGMIEGNHEYNESLIKRLHKVLRPFLLRRLKSEVEKQLPKKYEHIIMCRLSKRQRYLYDDFMAQTKTKETLATGNFMSVINILMQLRKVCNHPNMFDPRPTVSPFILPNITHYTASCVWGALDYDPFQHIDLQSMNFLLADTELCVTAFGSHRMKSFQLQPHMIEVIDNSADPMTLPAGKIKITVSGMQNYQVGGGLNSPYLRQITSSSHAQASHTISRGIMSQNTAVSSSQKYMTVSNQHPASAVRQRMGNPVPTITAGQQVVGQQTPEYTLQVVQQPSQGPPIAQLTPMVASQPFAVQLSPGARMPFGVGRLVQTSSGQHLIITPSVPASVSSTSADVPSVSAAVAYSSAVQNSISNSVPNVSGASQNIATVLPQMQRQPPTAVIPPVISAFTRSTTVNSISNLSTAVQPTCNKPVGRVAPLNVNSSAVAQLVPAVKTRPLVNSPARSPLKPKIDVSAAARVLEKKEHSPFHMESVSTRRIEEKRERMRLIYKFNPFRCDACPIYGKDLVQAVTMVNDMKNLSSGESHWRRAGFVNCLNAAYASEKPHTFRQHTNHLLEIVQPPEKVLENLTEIIKRFVFVTPAAMAPPIELHISHPHPSKLNSERMRIQVMNSELMDPCSFLHPIRRNTITQFPELRLIEYDCGKLQNLAILLHELKAGSHRVLIFTQMTRMLDILEQFLCFHGHTYLRLDGTTKVEQRQALMERFNADKKIFCFILSTRSGGIGVNLTGADTVIFYDSDWNPTMDAQAQDRCHRIGQTRDVHIYRLISERTVEENILKKANQKRLLGNLAIEGGNFTTAFFKMNTLHEIFGINEKEGTTRLAHATLSGTAVDVVQHHSPDSFFDTPEQFSEAQLEQALGMAEEELDLAAAKTAKDEAAAELAEFDESIPFDNDSRDNEEKTPAEEELDRLMDQLKPVERYAVRFCESLQEPVSLEQLKQAEEEIEAKKKDWELGRLKALQEEHERRSKQENLLANDDPLLCYSRETMMNQVRSNNASAKKRLAKKSIRNKPKRRSLRLNVKEKKEVSSDNESNDSQINIRSHSLPQKLKVRRVMKRTSEPDHRNANGPSKKSRLELHNNHISQSRSICNKIEVKYVNSHGTTECKPFANPNLVIRTRRASAIEAEERSRSDSEFESYLSSRKSLDSRLNSSRNSLENSLDSSDVIIKQEKLSDEELIEQNQLQLN